MKEFDFFNIIDVNKDKLLYIDNEDIQQEIDLNLCQKYWAELISDGEMTDIFGNSCKSSKKYHYICSCCKDIKNPYYEFIEYGNEPIRFVMTIKPSWRDYFFRLNENRFYEKFDELEKNLIF